MKGRQNWGLLVILAVMALSGFLLLREQSPASLLEALGRVHPGWVGLGLGENYSVSVNKYPNGFLPLVVCHLYERSELPFAKTTTSSMLLI